MSNDIFRVVPWVGFLETRWFFSSSFKNISIIWIEYIYVFFFFPMCDQCISSKPLLDLALMYDVLFISFLYPNWKGILLLFKQMCSMDFYNHWRNTSDNKKNVLEAETAIVVYISDTNRLTRLFQSLTFILKPIS